MNHRPQKFGAIQCNYSDLLFLVDACISYWVVYVLHTVVGTPRFMNLVAFLKDYTAIPVILFCLFIFRGT